jgi:thiol-disulfide isomerase/thioredoxin
MRNGIRVGSLALALLLGGSAVRADDRTAANVGQGGYMGISLEPTQGGLRVTSVVPASPASAAGISPGDVVILANGGPPGPPDTFTLSIRAAGAGRDYPVVVMRGNRRLAFNVHLAALPRMGLTVGQPPPLLVAQVVRGPGPGDLEQLRGRVVIVDFWASWCGPCRAVMPLLNQMHQRYGAQGLSVIGVTDESASIATLVGNQLSIDYTLAVEPSAAARFGVTGLPTMVVIDRHGNVRRVSVGVEMNELRQVDHLVQQLLAEPAPP